MLASRRLLVLACCLVSIAIATVGAAQPYHPDTHQIRLRVGELSLDGDSEYWDENAADFDGDISDFDDTSFGFDYIFSYTGRQGLVLSIDHYEGGSLQAYREFEDDRGNDILHHTNLQVTSVTAGWMLRLAGRRSPVAPYVGLGGGLYSWELIEDGDFIDFRVDPLEIFSGTFSTSQESLGGYLMAGIDVRLPGGWGVFAEGRWQHLEDELEGDFDGFGTIDLSGLNVFGGVTVRF